MYHFILPLLITLAGVSGLAGCSVLIQPGDELASENLGPDGGATVDAKIPSADAADLATLDTCEPLPAPANDCNEGTCYWTGAPNQGHCFPDEGTTAPNYEDCFSWNDCPAGYACVNLARNESGRCYELCEDQCRIGECTGSIPELGVNFCLPY